MSKGNAKDYLIFALDVPDTAAAIRHVRMLDGAVGLFKVGLELFVGEGPQVLKAIAEHSSAEIFLDLKLHDIPATVRGALASVTKHRVRFVTVHCDEGKQLLAPASRDGRIEVLAITVLTSLSETDLPGLGFRNDLSLKQLALNRAAMAKDAGCSGIVCSGEEVAAIRKQCGGDFKIVVPGIRPAWHKAPKDDQSRIVTPGDAVRDGADFIVVGRPIRDAKDPRSAAMRINEEIQAALDK
jgi:orotidine-5'-phosphate decarboxylase